MSSQLVCKSYKSLIENLQMKKRLTKEQIVRILREAETSSVQIRELYRKHNVTEQTFFRWRNKYGGMGVSDARRLRELESENARL